MNFAAYKQLLSSLYSLKMRDMPNRPLLFLLFIFLLAPGFVLAQERGKEVELYTVGVTANLEVVQQTALLKKIEKMPVQARIAGKIHRVEFEVGQKAYRGQVLAKIENKPYQLVLQDARELQLKAQGEYVNAVSAKRKMEALQKVGKISDAKLKDTQAEFEKEQNKFIQAQSDTKEAERNYRYTFLRMPVDGNVSAKYVTPFQHIETGTVVYEIEPKQPLGADFILDASRAPLLFVADEIQMKINDEDQKAIIAGIDKEGDKIKVTVMPELAPEAKEKQSVTVQFTFDTAKGSSYAYIVPVSAIVPGENENAGFVYRFDKEDHTVEKLAVRIRSKNKENAEIIRGIDPGDLLVLKNVARLKDGERVEVKR